MSLPYEKVLARHEPRLAFDKMLQYLELHDRRGRLHRDGPALIVCYKQSTLACGPVRLCRIAGSPRTPCDHKSLSARPSTSQGHGNTRRGKTLMQHDSGNP